MASRVLSVVMPREGSVISGNWLDTSSTQSSPWLDALLKLLPRDSSLAASLSTYLHEDLHLLPRADPGGPSSPLLSERDFQTRGPLIIATLLPLTFLATVFGLARLFVRCVLTHTHRPQLDDGVVLASLVSMWSSTATALAAVAAGHGRHLSSLNPVDTERVLHLTSVSFAFGIFSFALPKFAIVSLIVRLLNPGRWQRITLWGLVGFCFVVLFGNIPSIFSQCMPSDETAGGASGGGDGGNPMGMEDGKEGGGISYVTRSCIGPKESVYYSISSSAVSATTNTYLALYTTLSLYHHPLPPKRRNAALAMALSLGLIALLTALYKCTRLISLACADFTYDAADLVIWTAVEASTIIMAASIPVLPPLVKRVMRSITWRRRGRESMQRGRDSADGGRRGSVGLPKPQPNPFVALQMLSSFQDPTSITSSNGPILNRVSSAASSRSKPRSLGQHVEACRVVDNSAIEVEREVEVNYTWERNGLALPGGWVPEDGGESLRVTKDVGADGRVTITVAVVRSALHQPREGKKLQERADAGGG